MLLKLRFWVAAATALAAIAIGLAVSVVLAAMAIMVGAGVAQALWIAPQAPRSGGRHIVIEGRARRFDLR